MTQMTPDGIRAVGQQFLVRLYEQTQGDLAAQVSMYDIGEALGLDRENSARVAEELMGLQLVEIRTLSGGIGIRAEGVEAASKLGAGSDAGAGAVLKLGDDPLLNQAGCQAVEQATAELKSRTGQMGLEFKALTELMADLKTIDAQLGSSRPKTAIIRECLRSIKGVLEVCGDHTGLVRIRGLLGE
ncbi:MAG: hypothetical protein JSW39_11695 [Desulfobacterales bacterium]|nr:MAG: hypothetical protein JSW39_11695 [Desulfobacterales bacterium]